MSKIKVFVVDDAVVIRQMLQQILSADPDMEVAGVAANGKIALAKIKLDVPDIVVLDFEMPEMNGQETLVELKRLYPTLPVLMFSTHTHRGAAITMDALAAGAADYMLKPELSGKNQDEILALVARDLGNKIKALVKRRPVTSGALPSPPSSSLPLRSSLKTRVDIVAIGVSTGGPAALSVIIPQLPHDFPVPIVIVQHMPTYFTGLLAERLTYLSAVQVHEAVDGDILQPGQIWLAPGDYHMLLQKKGTAVSIALNQAEPENSCRPAVDVLFRSVASIYKANTLAVILTGMGKDGFAGCELIAQAGGQIVVQDAATSVVWGMPSFVAKAGMADKILPLNEIAPEIIRRASWFR